MARLGQLAADGWRVPDGYAVTAGALDGWLPAGGPRGARPAVHRPGARARRAGRRWRRGPARSSRRSRCRRGSTDAVADAHAPARVSGPGRGAGLRVAVRSSAVSEDGHAASFAGQYETYLGVSGVADVLLHVQAVLGERVLRARPGLPAAVRRRLAGARARPRGRRARAGGRAVGGRGVHPGPGHRRPRRLRGGGELGVRRVGGIRAGHARSLDGGPRVRAGADARGTGAKTAWAAFSAGRGRVVLRRCPPTWPGGRA